MLENLTFKELNEWIAYFSADEPKGEPADKLKKLAMALGAKKK